MKEDSEQQQQQQLASPPAKRPKIYPVDRILIYVRQPQEEIFTPLHISPPSVDGLLLAVRKERLVHTSVGHSFVHSYCVYY
jgi:hypothetical protein